MANSLLCRSPLCFEVSYNLLRTNKTDELNLAFRFINDYIDSQDIHKTYVKYARVLQTDTNKSIEHDTLF